MTLMWLLGTFGVLLLALFSYVGVRDRRRLSSADDGAASRVAAAEAHRHTAGREAQQAGSHIQDQLNGH
jgi:hypothetical protein